MCLNNVCFQRICKGVVLPPSGSIVVNDRLQGHVREGVQLRLAQSLSKDRAGQLEQRVCKAEKLGGETP